MANILIIDADRHLCKTFATVLEREGHVVVCMASAESGIHACENFLPDLVVLELQLQGHSGLEFLQEFRSYSEWTHIPVLLNTLVPVSALSGLDESFKTYGIIDYAYKPETTLAKLVDLIEDILAVKV